MAPLSLLLSGGLLAVVVALIVLRPRGIPVALPPVCGAAIALAAGLEPLGATAGLWGLVWDALLTLLGLMVISLVLDASGFFRWCAGAIARAAAGSGRRAWWGLMALAWAITALLANDGAMLILIPIYAEMLAGAGAERRQAFAFLFPAGFLIDAASTPLMTSNLTNLMAADAFHVPFGSYLRLMALPSLAIGGSALLVTWLAFRRHVPRALSLTTEAPAVHGLMFKAGWGALAALLLGEAFSHALRFPVCGVVDAVALVLLGLGLATRQLRWRDVPRLTPWSVAVFALGLFVVVDALARSGGNEALSALWRAAPAPWRPLAVGGSVGLLSAGLNNLPALLLSLLGFAHAPGLVSGRAIACTLVGANVAPKLTPYGSLATLLWLSLLEKKGFRVGWGEYTRYGLWLTPPVLALGLAVAWIFGGN